MAKEGSSNAGVFAVSMAVLGIILPFSAFPLGFIGGFVCSILGLIFGIIQFKSESNGWAKTALVLSVLGLIVNAAVAYVIGAAVIAIAYFALGNSGGGGSSGNNGGGTNPPPSGCTGPDCKDDKN